MSHKSLVISSAASRRGFSLIELMVVLSLTVLIASFAVVYSRQSGTQITLYVEAQKMAELIFKAKSMALTAYRNPALGDMCGFGFAIDYGANPPKYFLFSYGTPPPPARCGTIANVNLGLVSTLPGQSYTLSKDLTLASVANPLHYVLFVPPNPTTVVCNDANGSQCSSGLGRILLHAANGSVMTIEINSGGQINF